MMRTQKLNIQRIKLEVRVGSLIPQAVKPHFIAPPKGQLQACLGFYLEDSASGEVFTGYLREVNQRDISLDKEFKLIVRGIGGIVDRDKTRLAFLEQYLMPGNQVHVQAIDEGKNPGVLIGNFMKYKAFIDKRDREKKLFVNVEDYVFGNVSWVSEDHYKFNLSPTSVVSQDRYEKWRNVIL